jgi:transposase
MEGWLTEIVEKAKKQHGPVELKTIKDRHYLYKVSSVYDPQKKRARKVSGQYIGKVTPQGITQPKTHERTIYEYANAKLLKTFLDDISPNLRKYFPDQWREIAALAITKTIRNVPIKYVKDAWEKLYLSQQINASLSHTTVSKRLRTIGADWDAQHSFFLSLMQGQSVFFYDLSSIFSRSANLKLAEKGYNKEHLFLDQVNFALLFSQKKKTPVMLKSMPGSVRDIKSLHTVMAEFPLEKCILILDKGFCSKKTMEDMLSLGASFIQPLRRNSRLVDYSFVPKELFVYRERGIKYAVKEIVLGENKLRLFLFEDVVLRGEEHSNLIKLRVARGCKGKEINEGCLGRISILTNLDWSGEKVYGAYKEREDVELAFDAMKNELENDKCYLGDDDAVRGYFFVSFVSLYLYFRVLEKIRGAGMTSNLSVNELLFQLSKLYLIKYANGKERLSEIPSKVEDFISKLNIDILPNN